MLEGINIMLTSYDDDKEIPTAWRLEWTDPRDGKSYVHSFGFARRRDAEMALAAVANAGATFDDFLNMPGRRRC